MSSSRRLFDPNDNCLVYEVQFVRKLNIEQVLSCLKRANWTPTIRDLAERERNMAAEAYPRFKLSRESDEQIKIIEIIWGEIELERDCQGSQYQCIMKAKRRVDTEYSHIPSCRSSFKKRKREACFSFLLLRPTLNRQLDELYMLTREEVRDASFLDNLDNLIYCFFLFNFFFCFFLYDIFQIIFFRIGLLRNIDPERCYWERDCIWVPESVCIHQWRSANYFQVVSPRWLFTSDGYSLKLNRTFCVI